MELKKSNEKWSGRLDRAKAKDFTVKQVQVEVCTLLPRIVGWRLSTHLFHFSPPLVKKLPKRIKQMVHLKQYGICD